MQALAHPPFARHKALVAIIATLLAGAAHAALPVQGEALWLDASQGLTMNGNLVARWADQSGNGHDAVAGAGDQAALIPLPRHASPYAASALLFNGTSDFYTLANGPVLSSQSFTILAVAQDGRAATDNTRREIFSNWTSTNTFSSVFFGTTGTRVRFTDWLDAQGLPLAPAPEDVLAAVSNAAPFVLQDAGPPLGTLLNATRSTAFPTRQLTGNYVIGRQGTANNEYWAGSISELIVYNRVLNPGELAADLNYLEGKYLAEPVPEPGAGALCAGGAALMLAAWRRQRAAGGSKAAVRWPHCVPRA